MKSVSSLQRGGVRGQRKTRGSCVSEWEECEDLHDVGYDDILISMLMYYSVNASAHTVSINADQLFMTITCEMTKCKVDMTVLKILILYRNVISQI